MDSKDLIRYLDLKLTMEFKKRRANDQGGSTWTADEVEKMLKLFHEDDYSLTEVADEFDNRSRQSVKNKLRKVRKKNKSYNYTHKDKKYQINQEWIKKAYKDNKGDLKTLDGYAGSGVASSIYLNYSKTLECCEIERDVFKELTSNFEDKVDVDKQIDEENKKEYKAGSKDVVIHNDNINNLLHRKVGESVSDYDYIDLDPCGSPFVSIPQSIRLIEDGYLSITYGDIQLKRWGRHNPLMKAYRMPETEDFRTTAEYMVGWTMFEGVRQEKAAETRKLTVVDVKAMPSLNKGVMRVLFKVEKTKSLNPVLQELKEKMEDTEEDGPLNGRYPLGEYLD